MELSDLRAFWFWFLLAGAGAALAALAAAAVRLKRRSFPLGRVLLCILTIPAAFATAWIAMADSLTRLPGGSAGTQGSGIAAVCALFYFLLWLAVLAVGAQAGSKNVCRYVFIFWLTGSVFALTSVLIPGAASDVGGFGMAGFFLALFFIGPFGIFGGWAHYMVYIGLPILLSAAGFFALRRISSQKAD